MRNLISLLLVVAVCRAASVKLDIAEELSKFDSITDEFIDKINSAQDSWVAGHNVDVGTKFSDLKFLSGVIPGEMPPEKWIEVPEDIPAAFDARKKWPHCKSLQEIKNQGACGSCWAVSSASAMSDGLCVASNGKVNLDLSSQHVTSCSTVDYGCGGGWPYDAWNYFIKNGVPTGGDYHSNQGCQPYLTPPCSLVADSKGNKMGKCLSEPVPPTPSCQHKCYNAKYHSSLSKDKHYGKSVTKVPQDVKQIQAHIMQSGSVVAVIVIYDDFITYRKGVYHHTTQGGGGLHAIRIIGWGRENGQDYWMLTNSYGTNWGEKGIMKMLRGTNECGVEGSIISGITQKH